MKNLLPYLSLIVTVIFFTACQKELNFDAVPGDGKAIGSLKSSSGNCLPGFIFGAFIKDSANQSANQIDEWHDSLLNNSLPNSLHKQIQQNSDLDMVNNITQSIQKAITRYELHSA